MHCTPLIVSNFSPFLCDLYGLRGRCHFGLEDYEAAVWDGQRSKLLNEQFALVFVFFFQGVFEVWNNFANTIDGLLAEKLKLRSSYLMRVICSVYRFNYDSVKITCNTFQMLASTKF